MGGTHKALTLDEPMEAGGWGTTSAKMWTGREPALSQEAEVQSWTPDTPVHCRPSYRGQSGKT